VKINLKKQNGFIIAFLQSDGIEIHSSQDALDVIANLGVMGADRIIISEHNLSKDFFDLKSGLAGEILQKFSNYNVRLSIIGDFKKYSSKSFQDFMRESNPLGIISFVSSIEEARMKLLKD
jgi:hypothetical protein